MAVQFHEIAFAVPLLALSLTALLRGRVAATVAWAAPLVLVKEDLGLTVAVLGVIIALRQRSHRLEGAGLVCWGDRKSTRLNSSHVAISYAVFCLKKKKST